VQSILTKAIESYRRQRFLGEANADYAKLRSDSEAWASELKEREIDDSTLSDGLDSE
jgi:hypothetical protein